MKNKHDLLENYREFPCRTLPNAFWKTANRIGGGTLDIQYNLEGELNSLEVWCGRACLAFWCENPSDHRLTSNQLDQLEFALVHASSLAVFSAGAFGRRQPYFRVRHEGAVKDYNCPSGFLLRDVRPEVEIEAVAQVITSCYSDINVDPAIVRGWLEHPVYDPGLWVWLEEADSGRKAGLGIAELDTKVPEASLEWIQILPEFQNQGLGTGIVTELLRRVEGKVQFTTVSGELENTTQPERLYRKCGFTGSDVWWLLAP